MTSFTLRSISVRAALLGVASALLVAWNAALSEQRKNTTGEFFMINKENIELSVSCPGKIEPKISEIVRAEIDGRKLEVLVNVGDMVAKDQLMMRISDERISVELNQKRAIAKNSYADMMKSKKDYILEKNLYKQQAVPLINVENAREKFERARQSYAMVSQELALTEKRALGVRVLAPLAGAVVKNFVERDNWVTTGKELFIVAKLDKFVLRGRVDEIDIGRIKLGQEAAVVCDAFDKTQMAGVVSRIGAQAGDGAFAEIEVIIDILDTKGLDLKSNLSAEASIITGRIEEGIVIPLKAVRSGPKGAYVLVRKFGGWVSPQPVEVSQVTADRGLVASGLSSGQAVFIPKED